MYVELFVECIWDYFIGMDAFTSDIKHNFAIQAM